MSVYTGGKFYPLDPREDEVHIEDIAHALSLMNRFNGHTKYPYSVGQHSVLISKLIQKHGWGKNEQLFGLLHDAAEAYIGDVIRPFKHYLPNFKIYEDKILACVCRRFGVEMHTRTLAVCKEYDNLLCAAEKRDLHPTKIVWENMSDPSGVPTITPWGHSYAKGAFIKRYNELVSGVERAAA